MLLLQCFCSHPLFFVGFHNVDLMFNACNWASGFGFDCSNISDQGAFLVWDFFDAYRNGMVLMMGSFFLLMAFLITRLSFVEAKLNKLKLLHNEKVKK